MVVTLNPAISSNRAVVPMKKAKSQNVKSNAVSFEGEGSGMKGKSSFFGRLAKRVTLLVAAVATLFACEPKEPIDPPIKPPVDPPVVVDDMAVKPFANKYLYNVLGVKDTVTYDASSRFGSTDVDVKPTSGNPAVSTFTYNAAESSKDTMTLDLVSKQAGGSGAGRVKLFVVKDPITGGKKLGSKDYMYSEKKYELYANSSFTEKVGSLVQNAKSPYGSSYDAVIEFIPDGTGKVVSKKAGQVFEQIVNTAIKTR